MVPAAAMSTHSADEEVTDAVAAERGGQVWSLDTDFKRMARLGFVKVYTPK